MPTVSVIELNENAEKEGQHIETFEVSIAEVLFEELDSKGCKLPAGCLAGSCGTCRVLVIEGDDLLKEPSAVEQDTLQTILATGIQRYYC